MDPDQIAKSVIDPIAPAVDKFHDFLGHSPHPAIVALPLGAWAFSNVCDALGLLTAERKYDDAARLSMGIGLIGAAAAVVTGLRDYASIPTDRPSHSVATTHALGNSVVASLFAASYLMRSLDDRDGRRPSLGSRLLALGGGGLSLYTAWLGGVLVENYGEGVEPMMKQMSDHESRGGDDSGHGRDRLDPNSPLGVHPASAGQA